MQSLRIFSLLVILSLLVSCSSPRTITVESPKELPVSPSIEPLKSYFVFPFKASAGSIKKVIDDKLKNFYFDSVAVVEDPKIEIKDSKGNVTGTYTFNNLNLDFGIHKNIDKSILVNLSNNELKIDIPLEFYAHARTNLKHFQTIEALAILLNELYKASPELARETFNSILSEIENGVKKNLGQDVQALLIPIINLGRTLNEKYFNFFQFPVELTSSGINFTIQSYEDYFKGWENICEGHFGEATKSFESCIDNANKFFQYSTKSISDRADKLDKSIESALQKIGIGKDITEIVSLPANVVKESMQATNKIAKEAERTAERVGKEAARAKEKIGNEFERTKDKLGNAGEKILKHVPKIKIKFIFSYPSDKFISPNLKQNYVHEGNEPEEITINPEVFANLGKYWKDIPISIGCGRSNDLSKIDVSIAFKLNILNNYTVNLSTPDINFNWDKKCDITSISFVDKKIIEKIENLAKEQILDLQEDINNNFNFKEKIYEPWYKLQEPHTIPSPDTSSIKNFYYRIIPQNVYLNGIYAEADTALVYMGIDGTAEISTTSLSKSQIPLPANFNSQTVSAQPSINFLIQFRTPYDSLSKLLVNSIKPEDKKLGFTYKTKKGKRKIKLSTIDSIQLYGNGRNIIAKCKLKGFVKGIFYIEGAPEYDENTGNIYLRNLDWSFESKRMFSLLNIIDLTLHENGKKILNKIVKLNYDQKIEPQIKNINDTWKNKKIKENSKIYANFGILSAVPYRFLCDKNSFNVFVKLNAKAHLEFKN